MERNTRAAATTDTTDESVGSAMISSAFGAEIRVPGPFVVLQGMCGDGMANTMDSTPVVGNYGGEAVQSRASGGSIGVPSYGNNMRDGSLREDNRDEESIGVDMDMDVHMTTEQNNHNLNPSDYGVLFGSESQSSGEVVSSGELVSGVNGNIPQEISSIRRNMGVNVIGGRKNNGAHHHDPTAAETSSEGGYHPSLSAGDSDGDALFYDTTSPVSFIDLHVAPTPTVVGAGVVGDAVTRAIAGHNRPRVSSAGGESAAISSDGGLHLPIPPSSVVGMGYNSILPPVGPTSSLSESNSPHHDDSFVLIRPHQNHSQRRHPIPRHSEANQSISSASSSSIIDISRSFSSFNSSRYTSMTPQERLSIKHWNRECRERESQQREELLVHANPQSGTRVFAASTQQDRSHWWKMKSNCLAVFESLPLPHDGCPDVGGLSTSSEDSCGMIRINPGRIVGGLPPGCTVMGIEIISIDENSLQPVPSSSDAKTVTTTQIVRRSGFYKFLKIESPLVGYVLFGVDGYNYLGPGLPSYYADPGMWTWRVTCPDGAYVRQGLELTSVHVDTIPYGAFVRVTRKTVNAMGLSRLHIQATVPAFVSEGDIVPIIPASISATDSFAASLCNTSPNQSPAELISITQEETKVRKIGGWVSEALNPLSGQSGPVVQPLPFPVPVLYRVTLVEGAVIRSDVELSSCQIGHAPMGAVLSVVGRAYSNHPQDHCIERLRLSGGGGWVSIRLNRLPPHDELVLEMVGIDGSFDPNEPGLYHLEKQKQVLREYNLNTNPCFVDDTDDQNIQDVSRSLNRLNTDGDISSIEDGGNEINNGVEVGPSSTGDAGESSATALENSGELSNAVSSMSSTALPALYRSGIVRGDGSAGSHNSIKGCGSKALTEEKCLICLTESRTATIVHGSTGHIACCLMCARILKCRGDRCPVCRLPIDSVIQQFWA